MSSTFPTKIFKETDIVTPESINFFLPDQKIILGSINDGWIEYSNGLTLDYAGNGIWIVVEVNGIDLSQRRDKKIETLSIATLKLMLEEL